MKFLVLIGFLLCTIIPSLAQHNPEKMGYLAKSEKYGRMKRTGTTLTVVGSILFVVGVATLNNSTITTYSNGQTVTTGHPEEGAAAFLLGVAGLGAGIPLWIVGSKKEKSYFKKFENASLRFNLTPQSKGLTLSYRF